MLNTFLSGLLLAIVSGLAFVAYKHPKGYRHILQGFGPVFAFPFGAIVLVYTAKIATSIRLFGEKAVEAKSGSVSVQASSIESLNNDLTKLTWIVLIRYWDMPLSSLLVPVAILIGVVQCVKRKR